MEYTVVKLKKDDPEKYAVGSFETELDAVSFCNKKEKTDAEHNYLVLNSLQWSIQSQKNEQMNSKWSFSDAHGTMIERTQKWFVESEPYWDDALGNLSKIYSPKAWWDYVEEFYPNYDGDVDICNEGTWNKFNNGGCISDDELTYINMFTEEEGKEEHLSILDQIWEKTHDAMWDKMLEHDDFRENGDIDNCCVIDKFLNFEELSENETSRIVVNGWLSSPRESYIRNFFAAWKKLRPEVEKIVLESTLKLQAKLVKEDWKDLDGVFDVYELSGRLGFTVDTNGKIKYYTVKEGKNFTEEFNNNGLLHPIS